jgi:hypothetical protein
VGADNVAPLPIAVPLWNASASSKLTT